MMEDSRMDTDDWGEPPSCVDVNTPEFNTNKVDRAVQWIDEWSEDDMQTINENINFFTDMLKVCRELKENGFCECIPKKPKISIHKLLNPKTKPAASNIEEMHQYLISKIVSIKHSRMPDITKLPNDASLDMMKPALIAGYNCLIGKHKNVTLCSIQYGKWLDVACSQFKIEKRQKNLKGKWSTWLKNITGISDSYARQLREIFKLFGDYPKITQLAMPFAELYKKKDFIYKVVTNESKKEFWLSA
jgi:hypothetical protein